MSKTASKIVALAVSYLGTKQGSTAHKLFVDTYNKGKTAGARAYNVSYTDSWCATFISFLAIHLGYTDIIPTECGCEEFVDLCKAMGIWIENENRTPVIGDIVLYDWDDSSNYASTNNTGWSDHIGMVETVSSGTFTVIEGNKSKAVGRRTMAVNGRYIRGFAHPKYDAEETTATTTANASDQTDYAGNYRATTSLYVHATADKDAKSVNDILGYADTFVADGQYVTVSGSIMLHGTVKKTGKVGWASMKNGSQTFLKKY